MIDFPDTDNVENVADWAELQILYTQKSLSKSTINGIWQENRGEIDEANVDSVINELERRQRLYGVAAPFQIDRNKINPKTNWKNRPELVMCLIFSLRGVEKRRGIDDGTKLFEQLSREAVRSYLGGEAEVIGFPNKQKLKEQINCLCDKTREEVGHKTPKPNDKDKGVDIIAWKPHGDGRPNQIVLLLQCGAGFYSSKKKSISLKAWGEFVHWAALPMQGLMVPKIVSEGQLEELGNDYAFIFDRVRIFRAVHNKKMCDKKLRSHILKWCKNRLN